MSFFSSSSKPEGRGDVGVEGGRLTDMEEEERGAQGGKGKQNQLGVLIQLLCRSQAKQLLFCACAAGFEPLFFCG